MKNFNKYTINSSLKLIDAIYKIQQNKSREVIVLTNKKVIGILSEGDILRCILKKISLYSTIEKHYNKNFKYLKKYDRNKVNLYFLKYHINLIPIVDDNFKLKKLVTLSEYFKKK